MRRLNEMDARFYTRVRAGLEIDLAKELYALFNAQPIIGLLREGVLAVLHALINDIKYDSDDYKKESKIEMVLRSKSGGKAGREGLQNVMNVAGEWTASDCSDLIRLISTLLEKPAQNLTVGGQGGLAATAAGTLFPAYKPGTSFGNIKVAPQNMAATDKWSGRSRIDADKVPTTAGYTEGPRHIMEGRKQIDVERMVLGMADRSKAFYGIRDVQLMPHSTVRKIDIAFGLPQGADISGTTADSIIALKEVDLFNDVMQKAASHCLPEAILQLLPLATMVSLGHHTLLESALTLTISGYINYCIGFYSTLMPNPTNRAGIDEEVSGRMMQALRKAETHRGNVHFLCYHNGRGYEGLVYETDAEIEEFRKFAWVADPFREVMGAMSPHVPRDQLLDIAHFLGQRRLPY